MPQPASAHGYTFGSEENQEFWDGYHGDYQGAANAELLTFLARDVLGTRILDAGAGDGSLVRWLEHHLPHAQVRGIDLSPKHEAIEQGDLTAMPYGDATFDTVFCSEVIEHVTPETSAKMLEEIARVLTPGGALVLTTPHAEVLENSIIRCPCCHTSFHRWGHQQRFEEPDFSTLAERHGFEPLVIMPVRYSRVRRLRFLGRRFFRSAFMRRNMRRAKGKRTLMMIARISRSAPDNTSSGAAISLSTSE